MAARLRRTGTKSPQALYNASNIVKHVVKTPSLKEGLNLRRHIGKEMTVFTMFDVVRRHPYHGSLFTTRHDASGGKNDLLGDQSEHQLAVTRKTWFGLICLKGGEVSFRERGYLHSVTPDLLCTQIQCIKIRT